MNLWFESLGKLIIFVPRSSNSNENVHMLYYILSTTMPITCLFQRVHLKLLYISDFSSVLKLSTVFQFLSLSFNMRLSCLMVAKTLTSYFCHRQTHFINDFCHDGAILTNRNVGFSATFLKLLVSQPYF